MGSSLHGFPGTGRSLLQLGLPTGSQPPSGTSACSGVGSSMGWGCRWISTPLRSCVGCRGTACLTMVFATSCRGISAAAPGPPPPPSSLTLVFEELFLSHCLTPFSCCKMPLHRVSFLLKYLSLLNMLSGHKGKQRVEAGPQSGQEANPSLAHHISTGASA